ncbi:nucleotide exchange factor GrpE [bacterium 1XD42-94]|nr:nucleotide exchange factor GrpE [bacterium 1XD42-76]NBK03931.1 nucleotide exchange factor GrpE [bacterium 1XD42-94]
MEEKELEKKMSGEEDGTTDGFGLPEQENGTPEKPQGEIENEARGAEEAGVQSEDSENKEEKKEKKGFFSKKKDPKDTQIEELTDKLKRSMAEFDNYRKRTDKEKSAMYEIGARDVIEKMLPVVDNFERGLAAVPEDAKGTALADGMEKIYRQLMKALEELGVTPIEAVGKEFNPDFHNAVMHIEDENLGENIVAAEMQKGYMYRDAVVRHSMVQVAN